MTDYDKGVSEEFTVKSGDLVQLIREGEDGLWYADLCLEIFIRRTVFRRQMFRAKLSKASNEAIWLLIFLYFFFRFVKNLSSGREGWIPASNLLMLIGNSKSAQSLSSSGRLFILNEIIVSLKIPYIKESNEKQPLYNIFLWFFFFSLSQNQALPPALWAHHQVAVIAAMSVAPASLTLRANMKCSSHLPGR